MKIIARSCYLIVALAAKCPVPVRLDRSASVMAITAIHAYQKLLSGRTGATCLFHPSCSNRAVAELKRHGFVDGIQLAYEQLKRCGVNYTLSVTANGETWLLTSDAKRFGPEEISPAVRCSHRHKNN